MRPVVLYSFVTLGVVGLTAWLLAFAFSRAESSEAIGLSALVAVVVQIAAFSATRLLAPRNLVAAWGAGSIVRLLTLVVYALLAVKVLDLPAAPALLSLTLFFFLSTLLEPLFLRR